MYDWFFIQRFNNVDIYNFNFKTFWKLAQSATVSGFQHSSCNNATSNRKRVSFCSVEMYSAINVDFPVVLPENLLIELYISSFT
jgi:hypothetical protein